MASNAPARRDGSTTANWIGVDWGTTNLRTWLLDRDDRVRDEATSERGMSTLRPDEFEDTFLELVEPWLDTAATPMPTIACGMVGARGGWIEAPYARVPLRTRQRRHGNRRPDARPTTRLPRARCISQDTPPDVMRGEETQLLGEVQAFRTCLSGELFALLSTASVLRHSIATEGWDADAYAAALPDALGNPGALPATLFGLRASTLLADADPVCARARLSALLIGAKLATMRHWWEGAEVVLVGAKALVDRYRVALVTGGGASRTLDADLLTLAGLASSRRQLSPDLTIIPHPPRGNP